MKAREINLVEMPSKAFNLCESGSKGDYGSLFFERGLTYLNEYNFFLAYFNVIPNIIIHSEIDCIKAHKWFLSTFKGDIRDFYFSKRSMKNGKHPEYDDLFYILYDDLFVDFDSSRDEIRLFYRKTDHKLVNTISAGIRNYIKKRRRVPRIYILISGFHNLERKALSIQRPKLSITDNYNDDFKSIHHTIITRLNKKNDKGLVLLHGKPGTGKTSYIRYLASLVKKDVIFLPPNLAGSITSPDLINVLTDNPNSIFVIEDAENIVADRERNGTSPVSALLNIADGLLSDCLSIQLICSFNTDISKIDSALLRKGRLIAKYEFRELEIDKANRLAEKLSYSVRFNTPVSLSAVYNYQDEDYLSAPPKISIGFRPVQVN